jgi:hypothetical protein
LVESKNKWIEHAQKRDYSFVYRRDCFCDYSGKEIAIRVKSGQIVSAKIGNVAVEHESLPTMKQLFEYILVGLKKQEREENVEIKAEYHPEYGYPSVIIIKRPVMDGDAIIFIKDISFF